MRTQNINARFVPDAPDAPLNAAVKFPVTVGTDVRYPAVIAMRDISYVIDCIRQGRFEGEDLRALFVTLRGLPNSAQANAMKRALPWFCASRCVRRRANENVELAWFAIFDLDHVPDIEALKRTAIAKLPWVRYAFRSVRDGVKLLAGFELPIRSESEYRRIWAWLALQVEKILKHPVDPSPDWARACFFSYDPELLVNPAYKALNPARALKEEAAMRDFLVTQRAAIRRPLPAPRKSAPKSPEMSPDDFARASKIVSNLAEMELQYMDWVRVGLALYAAFGEAGKELWDLFHTNPNYHDTQTGLNAKWRSFRNVREITLATLFEIGGKYGCE